MAHTDMDVRRMHGPPTVSAHTALATPYQSIMLVSATSIGSTRPDAPRRARLPNGTFLPNERFLTERTGRKAMLAPSPNPQLLDCDD
jgi:hypothetical protein